MRTNLPVSQREYPIPEGETLVSTTDLDSRITYCNPSFIRVSGYDEAELIGQPHNLIRHPDMPAEAFRDMWATLRGGLPWSQLVKNRRKDGDHYWVVANVTPLLENGRPVGYMSVRTRATRQQIDAAEGLYATMRREASDNRVRHVLRRGEVLRAGWRAATARALRPGLTVRMAAALAVAGAGSAALAWFTQGSGVLLQSLAVAAQVGLVAGLAAWLHATVTRPIAGITRQANRMAAGELAASEGARRHDELGGLSRALRQLNVNLQALVGDVRIEARQIDGAAGEIATASTDLSARTEAQAGSLQETAAAIEQIAATVQRNAGNADSASRKAGTAGTVAERGNQAVGEVVQGMRAIEAAAGRIGSINSVIDGIAFQTNLLALNAAVEAARAGEQGRGFAVVAGEVRALAQRSAEAARQIKDLVDDSRKAVESGVGTARAAGDTLLEVVGAAREVGVLVEAISVASTEQSTGIGQVNAAVSQLDTATQRNAAMVEQTTASAQQLRDRARTLNAAVGVFKVGRA